MYLFIFHVFVLSYLPTLSLSTLIQSFSDGSQLYMSPINATYFQMNALVPINHWFSIGFGNSMSDTYMIVWQAFSNNNSKAGDYYSRGHNTPSFDANQYTITTYTSNATYVNFTSVRALNTGDSSQYIFKYGSS